MTQNHFNAMRASFNTMRSIMGTFGVPRAIAEWMQHGIASGSVDRDAALMIAKNSRMLRDQVGF